MSKMRFSGRKQTGEFNPAEPGILVIFGWAGGGKTTLARDYGRLMAPGAETVFCATRDSHRQLTCMEPMYPTDYAQVTECVDEFLSLDPKKYPVLCIDDLDQFHVYLEQFITLEAGVTNFRDAFGGFGAGHDRAIKYIYDDIIRPIRNAGRHIIAISHARPVSWEDPVKGNATRYEPTLSGRHQQLWVDEASAVWLLTHPFVEAKEMQRTIKKNGQTGMQLKIARRYFQDFVSGDVQETLAGLEPQDRIVCLQPTLYWFAKTRTDGRDFPRVAPLPAPPENTAQALYDFWNANGSARSQTKTARRSAGGKR